MVLDFNIPNKLVELGPSNINGKGTRRKKRKQKENNTGKAKGKRNEKEMDKRKGEKRRRKKGCNMHFLWCANIGLGAATLHSFY